MEALLGVAFVAQLRSQQAEVYFQYLAADAPSGHGTCSTPTKDVVDPGHERKGSALLTPQALVERQRSSSEGSLSEKSTEVFGIPSMIFAKLMLPEVELCNR